MTSDVAVICASPPGINPGMDSVDRALAHLAARHGFRERLEFYRLYPAGNPPIQGGQAGISYSTIPAGRDFFRRQRAIIYWGDFLHMRQYHETVAQRILQNGLCRTLEAARSRVREVFLQSGQDSRTMGRTLTFGSTLIFNTISDEMELAYRKPLDRFIKSCKGVWFRDLQSAFKACLIRGTFDDSCLGVDCANLIDPNELYPAEARPLPEARVGIFIGRTTGDVLPIVNFASELAQALECTPGWLSWGDANAFPALPPVLNLEAVLSLQGSSPVAANRPPGSIIQLLRYRAIVTDTYHLCVNAWNMGVPAICVIGDDRLRLRSVNSGDHLASRDKRTAFMSMYDALDFLIQARELNDSERRKARILHLINIIGSSQATAEIPRRIRIHAAYAEHSLVRALGELL